MVREFEPDGISVLDLDFTTHGVNARMERWYAHAAPIVGCTRSPTGLVPGGRTSREIAERLCLTIKAVDFHRMNLRKKLGIDGSTRSLQSRLLESGES